MAIKPALLGLAQQITDNFAIGVPAQPEDQLKAPITAFLRDAGAALGKNVACRTEVRVDGLGGRPDIGVTVESLLCGHIELKAPGLGADPDRLRGDQNKKQWGKFKSLPNLIYTDCNDWALYRNGERVGNVVHLVGDVTTDGEAAVDDPSVASLHRILADFFGWNPIVPHSPRELAHFMAPMALLLRTDVEAALQDESSALSVLRNAWREYLFPDVDDHQFADAYAQTLTYALLLARLNGADDLSPDGAARVLNAGNGLLADILSILGQKEARDELSIGLGLLKRSLSALDPFEIRRRNPDPWLYFYEDFLAAYDRKLRNDYGVYYTPIEVVQCQVRLASELLNDRFGKRLSFADDGVTFIDPAVGTGTYPLAAIQHALQQVRDHSGEGAVADRASQIARNMYGFEILVGPYAVTHLRLTQELESEGGVLPDGRVNVFLADTLDSPHAVPPFALDLGSRKLVEEHNRARVVKDTTNILVCLGNPPYNRQKIEENDEGTHRKGGWVRFGDMGQDNAIFEAFLEPARQAGYGVHLKNLYNDYVYFWRWALWKLFENQDTGGIVTFITASSYLAGPGFVGMREVMRRTFDDLWIINLEGDNLGTRRTENIFKIQIPVAIAIGVRRADSDSSTPAQVRYSKFTGTRAAKLSQLSAIRSFSDLDWSECSTDWMAPFLPEGKGDFFSWPAVTDLFPWQHSGLEFKRTWPIAETEELIAARWRRLKSLGLQRMRTAFRETGARKIDREYQSHSSREWLPAIINENIDTNLGIIRYGHRSFDRMYAIIDARFADRLRPVLVNAYSQSQVMLISLLPQPMGKGPGATASAYIPDRHYFRGSFGGKDVVPLWRDAAANEPNMTSGLLAVLAEAYGADVSPEELFAYTYAVLANPSYVERFWEELATPGPRLPLTREVNLFRRAVEIGSRLVWLHTYGERFAPAEGTKNIPQGGARCLRSVGGMPDDYPEDFAYDSLAKEIKLGKGKFGPVSKEVWDYEVSGLKVVQSWLAYRRRSGYGKKTSPLDDLRPSRWTPQMTDELLELLWVLEHTLDMRSDLNQLLEEIVVGECFAADDLPIPTDEERRPPRAASSENDDGQFRMAV